jgi:Cu/Ag efflux pump CusA
MWQSGDDLYARLGIFGLNTNDDAVGAIVVMTRTKQTSEMLPKVKAMVEKMNHDGSLPPGVKVVPFYDRGYLIELTTHTVVENLIAGIVLVFLIQWIFLGTFAARSWWGSTSRLPCFCHHFAGASTTRAPTCCPSVRWISASLWIRR